MIKNRKKTLLLFCVISAVFILLALTAGRTATPVSAAGETEISLYAMSSDYDEYLTIPGSCAKTYDIKAHDSSFVSARVTSGYTVSISNGIISPKSTTWYWNGGFGSTVSSGDPNERVEIDYSFGDSVVEITTSSGKYNLTVHVVNYAEYYADKTIDEYLAEHVNDSMTFAQKLDAITAMPAQYPYSASAWDYVSMIIRGGGDCWASTGLILKECEKLGINAKMRIANKDSGAGSGHRNVLAWEGDQYYELDAGYGYTTTPRYYSVKKRDSLFCFRSVTGGYSVYQYDGWEELGTTLEIPATYNGKPVVTLEQSALSGISFVKEIVVPEGVVTLGNLSISNCPALEKLTLPSTVTKLDGYSLWNNPKLSTITINKNSANFESTGNVIYSKGKTKLVYAANAIDGFTIPATVTKIGTRAFGYAPNLTKLTIPAGVKTIGEGAFFYCLKLEKVEIKGALETIADYGFHHCPKLKSLTLPASLLSIGTKAYGFSNSGSKYSDITIYGATGSKAEEYATENTIPFVSSIIDSKFTGVRKAEDGNWYYYKNGQMDLTKTGIVQNDAGYWYVENGQINFNYSGVVKDGDTEYVVKYGYMSTGFYGLVKKADGTWAYAEAGVLTYAYNGLAKNDVGWWYITNGVIDFSYIGIGSNATGDYRVVNGQIDFTYNGWFNANGLWWWMKGGMVDKTKAGLVKKDDTYYYVENGEINFGLCGLVENAGHTYYVWDGCVDFSFDGTVTENGVTYTIENGIVQS